MFEITKIFNTPQSLEPGETLHIAFGKLHYWLYKYSKEYHLNWVYDGLAPNLTMEKSQLPPSQETETYKWVHGDSHETFSLFPALPDKSIVVRSQFPLKIPSKVTCVFYLHIPTFLQFTRAHKERAVIFEKPSVEPSLTWFGDMDSGELCYGQKSSFYQELKNLPSKYYQAVCPIKVQNKSKDDLEFEKIRLDGRRLSLYQGKENLWTNNVTVVFEGNDKACAIELSKSPPTQEPKAPLLSKPRETGETSKLRDTFDIFKKFTGMT